MGYHLAQSGQSFQIVDAGTEIGGTWRSRWDSLQLFTSGRYDNVPGLPFPAAPDTYPGKDDVASYLQAYAAEFELPVRLNTKVTSLTRSAGGYVAKAGGETLEARQVVVATGPFRDTVCPADRRRARPRGAPNSAGTVPAPKERTPPGKGPGRRRRQLRMPDHRGALGHPPRGALSWPADAGNNPAAAGPRRVGMGERAAAGQGHFGLAAGPAAGRAGIESMGPGHEQVARRSRIPIRPRAASAAGRTVTFADGSARTSTPWCGPPDSRRTTHGSTSKR